MASMSLVGCVSSFSNFRNSSRFQPNSKKVSNFLYLLHEMVSGGYLTSVWLCMLGILLLLVCGRAEPAGGLPCEVSVAVVPPSLRGAGLVLPPSSSRPYDLTRYFNVKCPVPASMMRQEWEWRLVLSSPSVVPGFLPIQPLLVRLASNIWCIA